MWSKEFLFLTTGSSLFSILEFLVIIEITWDGQTTGFLGEIQFMIVTLLNNIHAPQPDNLVLHFFISMSFHS